MIQMPENALEMAWELGFEASREGFNGECEYDELGHENVFDDGIDWAVEKIDEVGPVHLAIRNQSLHLLRCRIGKGDTEK